MRSPANRPVPYFRGKFRVIVFFDHDWTLWTWENSKSLRYLASEMQKHAPKHSVAKLYKLLTNQLELLMGNLHQPDLQKAEREAVHERFARHVALQGGNLPITAEWSHTARAVLILERLGVFITDSIVAHMVRAEHEMFEMVAPLNKPYPDTPRTIQVLRERFDAEIVVVTSSDTRTMPRHGEPPLFDPIYSQAEKVRRLRRQGLFEHVPETHLIVAEKGKHHPLTIKAMHRLLGNDDRPTFIVTVGDTSGDMHVPTPAPDAPLGPAHLRIFVVRQRNDDGSFNMPERADHAVRRLSQIPRLIENALKKHFA